MKHDHLMKQCYVNGDFYQIFSREDANYSTSTMHIELCIFVTICINQEMQDNEEKMHLISRCNLQFTN